MAAEEEQQEAGWRGEARAGSKPQSSQARAGRRGGGAGKASGAAASSIFTSGVPQIWRSQKQGVFMGAKLIAK